MKYITKRKNGWAIQKNINGKLMSFGLYNTLEEAQHYRDYFVEHGILERNGGFVNSVSSVF